MSYTRQANKIIVLSDENLISLRKQITLNSLFVQDYRNTFGIDAHVVCDFFEGYVSYLEEIAEEDGFTFSDNSSLFRFFNAYDTPDNLLSWRMMYACGMGA